MYVSAWMRVCISADRHLHQLRCVKQDKVSLSLFTIITVLLSVVLCTLQFVVFFWQGCDLATVSQWTSNIPGSFSYCTLSSSVGNKVDEEQSCSYKRIIFSLYTCVFTIFIRLSTSGVLIIDYNRSLIENLKAMRQSIIDDDNQLSRTNEKKYCWQIKTLQKLCVVCTF